MPKPLLGLVCEYWTHPKYPQSRLQGQLITYIDALQAAGGIPVLIPETLSNDDVQQLYAQLSGLVLPGGGDVDPTVYGETQHPATDAIDPERDRVELYLTRQALADQKPFFGICRGVQVMNVALGGTLYQDLPTEFPKALTHYYRAPEFERDHLGHSVQVEEESLLARCLGTPLVEVNSRHHQAARVVAPGLQVVARAPDGVIEALELPSHPFALGVQWHPENLQAQASMRGLFEQFVRAAAGAGQEGR
jgi:putative glutamine amidotransferase